ncbi:hypothetical protein [Spirosoma areae]
MLAENHTIRTKFFEKLHGLQIDLRSELVFYPERITALNGWKELRFYWLYFDKEKDAGENPFANEIEQNLSQRGEEYLQSYKSQLRRLLNEQVCPLQTIVANEIEEVRRMTSDIPDRWYSVMIKGKEELTNDRLIPNEYHELLLLFAQDLKVIARTVTTALGEPVKLSVPDNIPLPGTPATDQNATATAPTSTPQENDKPNEADSPPDCKTLFIKEAQREVIKRQLSFDLDETNNTRLSDLLELDPPTEKIHSKTKAKVLANYFCQVYEAGHINNVDYTKNDIGEWLAYWFVKPNGKPYTAETFKDYLHMKKENKKLSSEKMMDRIVYHP